MEKNKMGQEMLEWADSYVRRPRKYYLGVASNGARVLRGSADREYTYAVLNTKINYKGQITWGSFHATEQLAKRQLTTNRNYEKKYESGNTYEAVKLVQITAKEVRAIKKEDSELHKKHLEFLLDNNQEARTPTLEGATQ